MLNIEQQSSNAVMPVASIDALQSMLQAKDALIVDLQSQIAQLKHHIEWIERQLFGQKSERVVQNAMQLNLGEVLGDAPQVQVTEKTIAAHTRQTKPCDATATEGASFFDESRVPVEVIELKAPEQANLKPDEYEIVSYKETNKLAQRPGSYVVIKYRRPVIKIKATEQLHCAPAPVSVIEGSRADVSFCAGLVVNKCAYHLPLYRQHQQLKDQGFNVSRPWLTQLVQQVLELCRPIVDAQFESILQSHTITLDETPIKAGRMEGKMKSGYFWPVMGDKDEVYFPYFPTRKKECVEELLGKKTHTDKVMLTDGYAAYKSYAQKTGITHAHCWAHTRREFFDAQTADPERCLIAIEFIRQLFAVEEHIQQHEITGENKRLHRLTHSKPIIERFYEWIDQQFAQQGLLPSNPFVQAMSYANNHRVGLEVFLTDPEVPISTNHIERALRVIPMGKKNWLFCWTELGAEHIGIAQSLIATCRLQNIDPYTYLVDVLQRISHHPASKVADLTPRRWKELFADNPMRSDAYHKNSASGNAG